MIQAFFIQYQFICTAELAFHDLKKEQPWYMRASWILSLLIYLILTLEVIRGWHFANKGIEMKPELAHKYTHEEKSMFTVWMNTLDPECAKLGNTFQVKERIRWCVFQILVVTLQILNRA